VALDPTFVWSNYVESCLWAGMGVAALVKRNSVWSIFLSASLLAFGISDIFETRTGAWYKPWWMLVWKVLCVISIIVFGVAVWRARNRVRSHPHD
jgi:hypothetical protein